MKLVRFIAGATMAAVAVTGCGGSNDGEDSAEASSSKSPDAVELDGDAIRKKLIAAGYDCGDVGPYEPEEGDMDLGVEPVEVLECTSGDSTIGAAVFESAAEVTAMTAIVTGLACGFGSDADAEWVASDRWIVSVEDAEGEANPELLASVGDALGVEPAPFDCPEDGGTDGSEDDGDGEQDGVARGSRDQPLAFGEAHDIGDGWTIKVGAFDPDATTALVAEDEYGLSMNEPPADGNRYVVVTPEATYNGDDESAQPFDISFSVVGASGVSIDSAMCVTEDPQWHSLGEVFQGSTLVGNLCFEVPEADVDSLVLIAEPTMAFSGNRGYLALR